MDERHWRGWGSLAASWVIVTALRRLGGWSWDKIWRRQAAALVIVYAAIVAFGVAGDIWLSLYDTVGPTVLLLLFAGGLALWALRLHRRYPPRGRP